MNLPAYGYRPHFYPHQITKRQGSYERPTDTELRDIWEFMKSHERPETKCHFQVTEYDLKLATKLAKKEGR